MGSSRCLLIVAVLFLFGCSKPRAELTIPEEELVKILADAHLIESALSTNYSTVKDSLTNLYYGQMYEIRGNLTGPNGKTLATITVWMTEIATGVTKFITIYPDKGQKK